jgi:hypothetical protein
MKAIFTGILTGYCKVFSEIKWETTAYGILGLILLLLPPFGLYVSVKELINGHTYNFLFFGFCDCFFWGWMFFVGREK